MTARRKPRTRTAGAKKRPDKTTSEKILEVASRLFSVNGFKGTSINDIAQRAKVNKATIFYYYGSKAKLLLTITAGNLEKRIQEATSVADSDLPPEKKLEALMAGHLTSTLPLGRLSHIGRVERKSLTPKMLQEYVDLRDRYEAIFRRVIEDAKSKGGPGALEAKYESKFTLGILNSIPDWYKLNGGLTVEEVAAKAAAFVRAGLDGAAPCEPTPAGRRGSTSKTKKR